MSRYLVGIMFHEPEPYALWNRGIIEDYESSTGLFVSANTREEAISWGEVVGQLLLRRLNNDPDLNWADCGYSCWIEDDVESSEWSHCKDFFQSVDVGVVPNLDEMGTAAYERWMERTAVRRDESP